MLAISFFNKRSALGESTGAQESRILYRKVTKGSRFVIFSFVCPYRKEVLRKL